ncbi:MAG TPA: ATP-binding cassette domain-containing protein [Acidimicrobiales bacterium]|nr:ATP-binding cassette domain-containing protein [Acidimicrobiales bacterium]
MTDWLLEADGLRKTFPAGRKSVIDAVRDVSISLEPGENVGLVGRPGAGKTLVARILAGLLAPDVGSVRFEGTDLATLDRNERRALAGRLHLIPQDLESVVPPKSRVSRVVIEPLDQIKAGRAQRRQLVLAALTAVLLPAEDVIDRRVSSLTPAERARLALARALILRPRLVIADEPTAALEPQEAADLVQLMAEMGLLHGVGYLLVTRDLGLAEFLCDRLVVMDEGRVIDQGPTDQVMSRPLHPRSAELVETARRQRPPGSSAL